MDRRSALLGLTSLPLLGNAPAALLAAGPVTVFEAAKIITMDPAVPTARFVAVADGIILGHAQTLEQLAPWTNGRPVTIDRLGSLERKGVPLGLHSDFNMAPIDPLYLA